MKLTICKTVIMTANVPYWHVVYNDRVVSRMYPTIDECLDFAKGFLIAEREDADDRLFLKDILRRLKRLVSATKALDKEPVSYKTQ